MGFLAGGTFLMVAACFGVWFLTRQHYLQYAREEVFEETKRQVAIRAKLQEEFIDFKNKLENLKKENSKLKSKIKQFSKKEVDDFVDKVKAEAPEIEKKLIEPMAGLENAQLNKIISVVNSSLKSEMTLKIGGVSKEELLKWAEVLKSKGLEASVVDINDKNLGLHIIKSVA